MNRLVAFLFAFVMLFSLAACNTDAANNSNTNSLSSENVSNSQSDTKSDNKTKISFEEVIAIDNEECTVKITDIDPDNLWGYTIKVLLENKSNEKNYMYSIQSASINGVQCNPLFATEVAAGKKSNSEIIFSDSSFENNDIGEYTDIELTFRVYDSNDWMADDVSNETIHIYPYGEDKAFTFVRETLASDNVIVDNDYVTVVVLGYEEDSIMGYSVNLFLINKTDKNIMFSTDNESVNGYMADPFYAVALASGKCTFSSISWFNSTLEENNIIEVEEIEFALRVYDNDNWFDDDLVNETIILNPQV